MEDVNFLVSRILFHALGRELVIHDIQFQSGGSINMAVKAKTELGEYFIKWNEIDQKDLFEKEVQGLNFLRDQSSLIIPEVVNFGMIEERSYLVLGFLNETHYQANYQKRLGQGLAELHAHKQSQSGFGTHNYIGKLIQNNEKSDSWLSFFVERRLNVQLGLAIYENRVDSSFIDSFKSFLEKIPDLLPDSQPVLLHGDFWNGNVMSTAQGPAVYDPAVYFGAPEMDLAMSKLFGGFTKEFYDAYLNNATIESDLKESLDIYNLYPLMVHVNLFGADAGYLGRVKRIISRFL